MGWISGRFHVRRRGEAGAHVAVETFAKSDAGFNLDIGVSEFETGDQGYVSLIKIVILYLYGSVSILSYKLGRFLFPKFPSGITRVGFPKDSS